MTRQRSWATVLATGVALAAGAVAARADAVYHSEHLALRPTGSAPLRSGFVENVHADGPNVYAHEEYVVNGALANARLAVVLRIYPGDTSCSSAPIRIPTATITTNGAGNGAAYHVFTPADADGLRGSTVGGRWVLKNSGAIVYMTACTTIHLD